MQLAQSTTRRTTTILIRLPSTDADAFGPLTLKTEQDLPSCKLPVTNPPAPPKPPELPQDEQNIKNSFGDAALKAYQDRKAQWAEVAQARATWKATGQIPQTKSPYSIVEIKTGQLMSRAERYDAMLLKQDKPYAQISDVTDDNFDPEFLTKQEFKEEFWSRVGTEKEACRDEYFRPGPRSRCIRGVEEKYGGAPFKAWRDDQEWQAYRRLEIVRMKIQDVVNSGPVATVARVGGYVAGAATGNDALAWSEKAAAVGKIGDVAVSVTAMAQGRANVSNYQGSAGLEVRRDALTTLVKSEPGARVPTPTTTANDVNASGYQGYYRRIEGATYSKPTQSEAATFRQSVRERKEISVTDFNDGTSRRVVGDRLSVPMSAGATVDSTLHTHPTSKVAMPSGADVQACYLSGYYRDDAVHQVIGDKWPNTRNLLSDWGMQQPKLDPIKWSATTRQIRESAVETVIVERPNSRK